MKTPSLVETPTLTEAPPSSEQVPGDESVPVLPSTRLPRLAVPEASKVEAFASNDLVLLGRLGQGGMGRVMLGQQRSLGREVALKMLRPDRSDADRAAALLREARVSGGLEHPNIIPVHALGLDEHGHPVLVMKRVDGVSLRQLLADKGHEGWGWLRRSTGASDWLEAALEALVQVTNAVEFAHSKGVIHRDIKPDNVMLARFGEVYLVDWGVALRTSESQQAGALAGTPAYMAPEMASSGPVTAASDVYLLGATLHEVVTGRRRNEGPPDEALARAQRAEPFAYPPTVPRELAELCNAACAAAPADRPGVAAFREGLLAYRRHAASGRLTRDALAGLASVRRRAAQGGDPAELRRDLQEGHFALRMALAEWPDNPEAARGLGDCLNEAARFELSQGNLEAARATLAGLNEPDEDLVARLRSAEVSRERERELLRQHDARPGARDRLALLALVFSGWVALFFLHLPKLLHGQRLSARDLLADKVINLAVMLVIVATSRRSLLENLINRRFVRLFFAAYLAILVHRVLGVYQGQDVQSMLVGDALLMATAVLMGASELGWLGRLSHLPLVGAALWISAGASRPALIFGLNAMVAGGLLLVANHRAARAPG